jgi:hypothetical protein
MKPAEIRAIVSHDGKNLTGNGAQVAFAKKKMLTTLTELGIRPFSPKKVAAYQRSKVRPILGATLGELGATLYLDWGFDNPVFRFFFRFYGNAWFRADFPREGEYTSYTPIPREVRIVAEVIKQKMPDATLSVEYFQEDPFLIVHAPDFFYSDVHFYVAVWDEKNFKIAYD